MNPLRLACVTVLTALIGAGCAPREPLPAPGAEELPPLPAVQPLEGVPADTVPAPPVTPRPRPAPRATAAAARWVQRAPLTERRTEVSATTDGQYVYLAGGFGPPQGEERATAPRTLWRYDPQADGWTALTQIPQGVHHTAFVHLNNRLYLLGGFRETSFDPVGNVRIYDLASGQWSEGAPMPTPRGAIGFAVLEGRIHLVGGNAAGPGAVHDHEGAAITEDRSVNTHEAYDPATDTWQRLAPMPTPRNHLGAAAFYGRIHAVAGRANGNMEMTVHEIYDPATNSWSAGPAVPTGRSGIAVLAHDGFMYVFGGERFGDDPKTFDEAERFDPRGSRWESLPPMPTARHGLGAAAIGTSIYVVSGGPQPAFHFSAANERLDLGR
ncbi:kelch repeat-containing protein [soil metagenome]|nr:galactose oxidase [Gemmatimonadota bacterium]